MPDTTDWATRINATWRKSVEHIIETGRLLREAKAELGHGNWCGLFSARGFDGAVPFTVRTAQMLMVIADHPVLSDANHGTHLPPCWRTLYELSSVPDDELIHLIEDGTVHPGMMRKDVAQIPMPKIDQFLNGLRVFMNFYRRYKGRPDVLANMIRYAPEVNVLFSAYSRSELSEELPEYVRQMFEELDKLYQEDKQLKA
jgi:hypothetical protein